MSDLLNDLRIALRTLTKNRAFAIAAVATLPLGIGANSGREEKWMINSRNFSRWQERQHSFDALAGFILRVATVSVVLLAVALAASCVPARRASVVDPMVALRYE